MANSTQILHRHPRAGERGLKVYVDGAWAGLAAGIVLAATHYLARVWGSHDSAEVVASAVVWGVIGLGLGPVFSLITKRLRVRTLLPSGVIFAVAIALILGRTSAAEVVPALLYGATLGLTLRSLRRVAAVQQTRSHRPGT